jgi:hypothetical protein
MFVGKYHDWRLRLVLQCRVQVTRIRGNTQVMSLMQPYSLRNYTFIYFMEMQVIHCFVNRANIC